MAFGQIYKVLEMEPLPSNKQPQKYPWCDKEGVCTCRPSLYASLHVPDYLSIQVICLCEGSSIGLVLPLFWHETYSRVQLSESAGELLDIRCFHA